MDIDTDGVVRHFKAASCTFIAFRMILTRSTDSFPKQH